ncbi:MAG: DNA-directed RNA polymerase subunit omega [bacterium]|nr:DNA-directed RNA polymerase subunit omega [bacterium]
MYKLPENLESKYRFVTLASKRAEQLQVGALARVENPQKRKTTVVAQEEVAKGFVGTYDPEVVEVDEVAEEEEE